jgi:hypothetical protein
MQTKTWWRVTNKNTGNVIAYYDADIYAQGDLPYHQYCNIDLYTGDMLDYHHRERAVAIVWAVEDVIGERPHITPKQAMDVLENCIRKHDADMGITWETIRFWADELYPELTIAEQIEQQCNKCAYLDTCHTDGNGLGSKFEKDENGLCKTFKEYL